MSTKISKISKIRKLIIAAAMAVFLIIGCSSQYSNDTSQDYGMGGASPSENAQKGDGDLAGEENPVAAALSGEQKLIRNGSIHLRAENIDAAQEEVRAITSKYDGYVFSLRQSQGSENRSLEIVIKVASQHFDAALEEVKGLGTASDISMNVRDVTTEFIDTEARIETLEVKEETLMELLSKATAIEDILLIEGDLQRTRQEIESYQGRLNTLINATDYSTITIYISDREGLAKTEEPISPSTQFRDNLNRGIRYWSEAGINVISGILFILPVLIPVVVILIILLALRRKYPSKKTMRNQRGYIRQTKGPESGNENMPPDEGPGKGSSEN